MIIAPFFVVALGGSIGAIARYLVALYAQNHWGMRFPCGTLFVNCTGSFIAGFLLIFFVGRYNAGEYTRLFFFTGFLGAYTTFSSFAGETLLMYKESQWLKLCSNILLNNIGSLAMALIGALCARYALAALHQP